MSDLLSQYKQRIRNTKSKNTIRSYEYTLDNQLFPNGIDLSPSYVDSLLFTWKNSSISSASIRHRLSVLKSFLQFIHRREPVSHYEELLEICGSIKQEEKLKEALTKNQVEILLANARGSRDTLMIYIMAHTGVRISELLAIEVSDVTPNGIHLKITEDRTIKNHKERLVPITSRTFDMIQEYILENNINGKLFNITAATVQRRLRELSLKTRIYAHPHAFRRFFVTALLSSGVDPSVIMQLTGHKSYNSLFIYASPSNESKMNAIEKLEGN